MNHANNIASSVAEKLTKTQHISVHFYVDNPYRTVMMVKMLEKFESSNTVTSRAMFEVSSSSDSCSVGKIRESCSRMLAYV
jgi:hypothetical protein